MHYSFGLGESSLDHRRREEFPAIFTMLVSFDGVYGLFVNSWVQKNRKLRQRVRIKNPLIIFDEKKCGEYGYGIF